MTTEQELNEKLAKWAGFKKWTEEKKLPWETIGVIYKAPDNSYNSLPTFANSLDICFKWLVPKLAQKGYIVIVGSFEHNGYYAFAYYFLNPEPTQTIPADTPALALCRAIEQLIDSKIKL